MGSHGLVRGLAAAGLVVGLATGAAPGAAAGPAVPAPLAGDAGPQVHEPQFVYGVAAIGPNDVLTVGTGGDDLSVRGRHWDGHHLARARPEGTALTELWSVAAISATDAWGVGNAMFRTLAEHWDGNSWTRVLTPPMDPDDDREGLYGVAGASSSDVWAVGFTDHCRCGRGDPLILHWDGTSWTRTPVQLPGDAENGGLTAVTVISADDARATGSANLPSGAALRLTLHWDGRSWKQISTHPLGASGALYGIDAITTNDIWAVGAGGDTVAVLHWDGSRWTRYPPHDGYHPGWVNFLFGVTAIASDDVWAVGGYGIYAYTQHNRVLHWDGTRWQRVHVRDRGTNYNELRAVSGTGPDDIWAVGSYSDDGDHYRDLYLHYDGTKWRRVHKH